MRIEGMAECGVVPDNASGPCKRESCSLLSVAAASSGTSCMSGDDGRSESGPLMALVT